MVFVSLVFLVATPLLLPQAVDYTQYVSVFRGTQNGRNMFPGVKNLLEFEELVAKKVTNDVTWYEAGWQGQPDAENIWVGKKDIPSEIVAAFEAKLRLR